MEYESSTHSWNYFQDHLGSSTQLRNTGDGASVQRYDYKSYGKLEGNLSNTTSTTTALTYTGREDDNTGLYYYRARYYDPNLELFISEDPLGDAQRYVGGNPLKYQDPLGLDYWVEEGVASEGGGSAHRSICVGSYNGIRACNSFGAIKPNITIYEALNTKGRVYRDISLPGKIVSGTFQKTSASIDILIKDFLDQQFDDKNINNVRYGLIDNNCRTYVDKTYLEVNRKFIPQNNKIFFFGSPSLGAP